MLIKCSHIRRTNRLICIPCNVNIDIESVYKIKNNTYANNNLSVFFLGETGDGSLKLKNNAFIR